MGDRRNKLQSGLLSVGQFQHALDEMTAWLDRADAALEEAAAGEPNDKRIETHMECWADRSSVRSFARTAHSFAATYCSLRSRPPLRTLVHSLDRFAHSLARGKVND